ncbi:little elongation complex subunit 2-like [Gigantopelta aegis]|uniref:little elongation complex subunit 2-like n=1 Tax=Gigantopelta aegis TaxID=1735272 RepID=UPI001B88AA20|nr:little elongation complex subunit 2-like [Gigantopelta aegis]
MEPVNGKEYFFTEESFLRVAGPNSFEDWLRACLSERGYTCDIAAGPLQRGQHEQRKERETPSRGYDKKDRPSHAPDKISKLKCLQKPSSLTHGQQKRYLDLFQKYILTVFQKQPTPADIKELTELESLQVKVSAEQSEFLKCLESISKSSKAEYNILLPDAKRYIEEKIQNQRNMVNQYPKHYSTLDVIPIEMKAASEHVFDLVFQKTVLQLGPDPKVFLPDIKASTKPVIPTSYEKIVKRFPPPHPKKDEHIWNHEPCSKDTNAEILADKYVCDVVLSSSVLQCLVDNHSPNYDRDWQIPVVVKRDPSKHIAGDSDSQQMVVYLDKPLCPKVLSNRQKNTLYHKYALKAYITHPAQNKGVKASRGSLSGRDDVKLTPVSSRPRTGSIDHSQEADNLFETETTIDDLETFGSFDKMPVRKHKAFTADVSSVTITSKPTPLPAVSSGNNTCGNLSRQNSDVPNLADFKSEKNSDSVCLTDTGATGKPSSNKVGVADAYTDVKVKNCKERLKADHCRSDTDSDEENMLVIDCNESEGDRKALKHSITATGSMIHSATTAASDVLLVPDIQKESHSKGFAEEHQVSPMSPDKSIDIFPQNKMSRTKSDSVKDGAVIDNVCNLKSSESDSQSTILASMQLKETVLQKKKLVIVVPRCDQNSPISPESKGETSCIGGNSVDGHSVVESPLSPDDSTKTPPKMFHHPKSFESESDSHDDSLVIDMPAESEREYSQVFLSPRALRARKRYNSSDTCSLSQPQTEMSEQVQSLSHDSEPVQISEESRIDQSASEKTEDKLISIDTHNADISSLDKTKSAYVDGDATGVKRKRGRPRKEKAEEVCKKFKSATNSDLPETFTVKEGNPGSGTIKSTSNEHRRKTLSKPAGSSTLESILQLQNQMLPSTPGHHNKLIEGDNNTDVYKQPEHKKISYNLWDFSGLRVLTRASSHGTLREYPNKLYPVSIVPKLEYQAKFGVEQITQSEMSRDWVSCLIKPNTHLIRGRINAQTSEIIMLEDLDISKVLQPSIPFNPQEFLCFLHGLFLHLKRLPVGNYLLTHSKGESYINILNSIDAHNRGSYDLHFDHKVFISSDSPKAAVPWIPIDPTVILPFHKKHGRVPATFEPKDFRKIQKKNKGKGKKK